MLMHIGTVRIAACLIHGQLMKWNASPPIEPGQAPTYATPPKSFQRVGLESSSTVSPIPADYPKPISLAVVSLDSR